MQCVSIAHTNIVNWHSRQFRLYNQQRQKSQLVWRNLTLWIVFVWICVTWSAIGNAASAAANIDTCQNKGKLWIILSTNTEIEKHVETRLTQTTGECLNYPQIDGDSELGILRVRDIKPYTPGSDSTSELGTLRMREQNNSELGTLRMRVQEAQPPKIKVKSPQRIQPTARLLAHIGYFQTSNIFSGVDPVNGELISSGLTFRATPALGPKINLVTSIDGSLIRYLDQPESNYNQLRFRAGLRSQLSRRTYGEIGWNNQQLFREGKGDRFLNEHSVRLALYRQDQLTNKLRLDSFYEFRLGFADPNSRSRLINSVAVSLSYYIQRNLQIGLDYQFGISQFIQRERQDQYHRLLGRLTYSVSRNSQMSVQGGLSLGGSSNPNINFDDFFFSVSYTIELGRL